MKVKTPMAAQGWKPRVERERNRSGGASGEGKQNRKTKRSRLGNAIARNLYTHAKGHKMKGYGELCQKADRLNNQVR